MRLINERTQVQGIAERWRSQYPAGSKTIDGPTEPIYEKLKAERHHPAIPQAEAGFLRACQGSELRRALRDYSTNRSGGGGMRDAV